MKLGIIGFGHLGQSLASGLIKSGIAPAGDSLFVCDISPQSRALAEKEPYCANVSDDVNYVIGNSDIVFLAVMGSVFEGLSASIDRRGLEGKTVVSFMAGETFEKIYSQIGEVRLVRAMPTLAIAECSGVIGYTKCPDAIAGIFKALGLTLEVEPEDIEKVMAFSACGLGFAAYLIDVFSEAGRTMGFEREICEQIAANSFRSAVERGNFRETVEAVSTKGGATELGVKLMDEMGVYDIVAAAVKKAYDRMA